MLFFFTVFQYKSPDAEVCPLYCLVSILENIQVGNLMCYLVKLISIIDTSGSDTRVETLAEVRYSKSFMTERSDDIQIFPRDREQEKNIHGAGFKSHCFESAPMYEERCLILPELQQTYVTRWMSWDLVWNRYVSETCIKLTLQFRETWIYECQVLGAYLKKLWATKFGNGTKTKGVISGFRREVVENWSILGYYAASSGNFLRKCRDDHFGFLALEDGTDRLSRSFGKLLPLFPAW
jgi:hypothetical protein